MMWDRDGQELSVNDEGFFFFGRALFFLVGQQRCKGGFGHGGSSRLCSAAIGSRM